MSHSLIPDSSLAKAATELVRDTENDVLFNHSSRVYLFAAETGKRRGLKFDAELLYVGAMFHDMGLTRAHSSENKRFEVDSADCARAFLQSRNIAPADIETVWTAIALHTTPGIPEYMRPVIALVSAGVELDVLGIGYDSFPARRREEIVSAFPRPPHFKEDIIQNFYDGIKHKPQTAFGNVKADVLADKDPHFKPVNFCRMIRCSHWRG